jgi:negative regulator of sigma E activity
MKRILKIMILLVASLLVIQTVSASSYQKQDLKTLPEGSSNYAYDIFENGTIEGLF